MRVKHNKKRNTGILFSQLTEYISEALVEGNSRKAQSATNILKKHFKKGSQLYNEYKVFKVLTTTNASCKSTAEKIVETCLEESNLFNLTALRKEKSSLIKDINYVLGESNFYDRRVSNFRVLATIQSLINERQSSEKNLELRVNFKNYMIEHLSKHKERVSLNEIQRVEPNADKLTLRIMKEKFEEKFSSHLSENQSNILRSYIFSESTENLTKKCKSEKSRLISLLSEFKENCDNDVLLSKIDNVRRHVTSLKTESFDDDTISRYLTLIKLTDELSSGD